VFGRAELFHSLSIIPLPIYARCSSQGWKRLARAKQVQITTAATKGTTVWVYRNTVYGYPWYTDVRMTLEDPAYAVSRRRLSLCARCRLRRTRDCRA
jgi:hypothetical protein